MSGKATKLPERKFSRLAVEEVWSEIEPLLKQFCIRYKLCGSYRRGKELIGDIDIVIIPIMGYISMSNEAKVLYDQIRSNNKRTHVVWESPEGLIQVDFYVAEEEDWGAQILTWTGDYIFNTVTRTKAKRNGMKLSQYGLFDRETDRKIAGETERSIFDSLDIEFKYPNQRSRNEK